MPAASPRALPDRHRRPQVVTLALVAVISAVSLVGYGHPQVVEALQRQRGATAWGRA